MPLRFARPAVLVAAGMAYAAVLVAASSGAIPAVAAPATAPATAAPATAPSQHGTSGDARFYRSRVTAVAPAAPGLGVTVGDGGAVTLENTTGAEVVVLGYAGEPYLRFTDGGMVLRNRASLTSALVAGRAPGRTTTADGEPLIDWEHVVHEPRFTWPDARTRWSAARRPPVVEADARSAHRVLDWALDVTVGGRRTQVRGAVDWIGDPAAAPPATADASADGSAAGGDGEVTGPTAAPGALALDTTSGRPAGGGDPGTWTAVGGVLVLVLGGLALAALRRRPVPPPRDRAGRSR